MSKRKVLLLGAATMAAGAAWLGIRNCSIAPATISAAAQLGANEKSPVALVAKNVLVPLTLVERTKLTHDTENFRFSLPDPEQALGLPTGQHVHLQTEINGKWLVRLYTPVSSDEDKGITDIVAKLYRPNEAFPEGGKMSKVLDALKPGDVIHARGPTGNFFYRNNGNVALKKWKKEPEPTIFHKVDKIVMIAGGSGITPMLQLIKHVLKDPTDDTKLELLFANKSEEDIMLRDQLESLSSKHPQQFKVWYTLDKAPPGWKYSEGFINADMVKKNLSPPAQDTFVLLCGPKPMIERACLPTLESLGYSKDRIHKF